MIQDPVLRALADAVAKRASSKAAVRILEEVLNRAELDGVEFDRREVLLTAGVSVTNNRWQYPDEYAVGY